MAALARRNRLEASGRFASGARATRRRRQRRDGARLFALSHVAVLFDATRKGGLASVGRNRFRAQCIGKNIRAFQLSTL